MSLTYGDIFGSGDLPAEGDYHAKLTGIRTYTSKKDGSTFRIWSFLSGDLVLEGSTSMNTGPDSKAYMWLAVILGHEPKGNDVLQGRPCIVTVEHHRGRAQVVNVKPDKAAPVPDEVALSEEALNF